MSGASFHVHGPHDHELEHAAQHGEKDRSTGTIAVMTAILATIGALFAYMGGATQANAEAKDWDTQSDAQMHLHHRWAQATTALQISIALAAIALLTRRKWVEWGMLGVAAIGVALGTAALLHV